MRVKIPLGKVAAWIARALLSAMVSEAADRLSRPKKVDDRRDRRSGQQQRDADRLDRE
ncbi:hypothetical protein [Sphingobium sp. sgz301303]|uniref:hypothetical protein n=1 Tax=Sphingobium sp. sgz301303 TaxID=3342380 RepID=UPI0035BC4E40